MKYGRRSFVDITSTQLRHYPCLRLGSAIWIAQLVISAVGADEGEGHAVALYNPPMSRHPRYVAPVRALETRGNASPAPAAADAQYKTRVSNGVNHIKFTVPQNHSKSGTGIPQDVPISKGRGTVVEDENLDDEDQDDDDDDDDDDWDHV